MGASRAMFKSGVIGSAPHRPSRIGSAERERKPLLAEHASAGA